MTWKLYRRDDGKEIVSGMSIKHAPTGSLIPFSVVSKDGKTITLQPYRGQFLIFDIDGFPDYEVKRHVGTISFEPTWTVLVPLLIATLQDGTPTGKQLAREELERMARAADAYNAGIK